MLAMFAVEKYSGAHINPVVTLVLAYIGEFPWRLVPVYVTA